MSNIISLISEFVTACIGWIGDIVGVVTTTGNELLLLPFIFLAIGFVVGIIRRMFALR